MKYRYDYICKLITNLKKYRTINTDIIENNGKYTNTDIRYLILTILMNNGLLFDNKFSDNNWIIDRNDFSSFCIWNGLDGKYSNIVEVPNIEEIENKISDWSFLDEESEEEDTLIIADEYYDQGDDYIISIFKGEDGNISGPKIMNQIRNKLFHNQFSDYDNGIVLNFAEGQLEIEDEDIYVIFKSYLKSLIKVKAIKQLLNNNYLSEDKEELDQCNLSKINEIISMFQFLYTMINNNSYLESYSKINESLFSFNNILNAIDEIDSSIIRSISKPDYEKAQLSSLFSMVYVMSDLKKIDISSLDFSFLNVKEDYSTTNENIIRHIRNCFAHGYHTYQEDNIIIKDYNKEGETFSAVCSINDFIDFSLSEYVLNTMYDNSNSVNLKR